MNEKVYNEVIEMFDDLVDGLDPRFYPLLAKTKDIYIAAPKFFIDVFKRALEYKYRSGNNELNPAHFIYRDIQFVPGYELAIVLYHKDYVTLQDPYLMQKFDIRVELLDSIVRIKHKRI